MMKWTVFPHRNDYCFDIDSVTKHWSVLHAGDAEPLPYDPAVLKAWVLFHNGDFQKATSTGLQAGKEGLSVANKATCSYACYLEKREKARQDLLLAVTERAEAHASAEPENANAWYWRAHALSRYAQGISVSQTVAQGVGEKIKESLERVIELQPLHADAHITLGAYHAEVIDKLGALIAGMTFGASKDAGLRLFETGLRLNPASAFTMVECANGILMLEGDARLRETTHLYEKAAHCTPLDAVERLNVELARAELQG